MMKKFLHVFLIMLGVVKFSSLSAQMNYTVSYPTATFTALTTGTVPTLDPNSFSVLLGADQYDEGSANGLTLPFTFNYNGVNYTTFNVCANGFMTLGSTPIDSTFNTFTNNLSQGPSLFYTNSNRARPIIAPLWDDLWGIGSGTASAPANYIRYSTTGTSPNRVLTIQWLNARWTWQASAAGISFQVKLYETTNVIEFIYRQQTGALSTAAGASIGLADIFTGSGGFMSQSGVTSAATTSTTSETTTIATKPASNFCIRYTPTPIPVADAGLRIYTAPVVASCFYDPASAKYIIKNAGTGTIAAGAATVNVTLSGTSGNTGNFSVSNSKVLAQNQFDTVTINGINVNLPGSNTLTAIVSLTADGRQTNDTSKYSFSTAESLSNFPVMEDAVNVTGFPFLVTFFGSQMWRRFNASSVTIPNNANPITPLPTSDPADTAFYCALTRYTGSNSDGWSSLLYSHCLQIPAGLPSTEYNLAFYMTQDSAQSNSTTFTGNDSLFVRVSTDTGKTWSRIADFGRMDINTSGFTWVRQSIPLDAYAGKTIQIGFEAQSELGNVIGLDSITVTANFPLPVNIGDFKGNREGYKNVLQWNTLTEQSNNGFEIQRGSNTNQFTTVGFVKSKGNNGNSSSELNYSFDDIKPINGANYYRLRQVDFNGKESYSKTILIRNTREVKAEISGIYPNPVQNNLNIALKSNSSEVLNFNITDLSGKLVYSRYFNVNSGDNNININVSNLAKGSYLIKVVGNNVELATQKFVKM